MKGIYTANYQTAIRSIDDEIKELEESIRSRLALRDRLSKRYRWKNAKVQRTHYRKG